MEKVRDSVRCRGSSAYMLCEFSSGIGERLATRMTKLEGRFEVYGQIAAAAPKVHWEL